MVGVVILGEVSVLLVNVSVVVKPTKVVVAAGKVIVFVPATAVACTVIEPDDEPEYTVAGVISPVVPLIVTGMIIAPN